MKRVIIIIVTVVLFLGAAFISPAYIAPESSGHFYYYEQPDGTVKIYKYSGNETQVNVPDVINGKKVSGIADECIGYGGSGPARYKSTQTVIIGYYGSAAYEYAKKENFKFTCLHDFKSTVIREATYGQRALEHLVCDCGYEIDKETEFKEIPKVEIISAKSIGNGIEINWQPINGVYEYNIYRRADEKVFEYVATATGDSYIDYGPDSNYWLYLVKGVAGENESEDNMNTCPCNYFKSPDFTLNSKKNGIKIDWNDCKNAVKYRVYKKDSNDEYKMIFETKDTSVKTYLDTDVKKQSEYFYSVVSVDAQNQESVKTTEGNSLVFGKKSKVVYLTFDDGPSENTLKILKILKKYKAKATFFVTGNGKIEYMKNIVNNGHTIALHTYSHDYESIYSSTTAYFNDLNKISKLVYDKTGVDAKVIRFPGGSSNTISANYSDGIMTRLTGMVEDIGYEYFDWNVNSGDADGNNVSPAKIIQNIKSESKDKERCVVLMHDTKAKSTTVKALDSICAYYKRKGYEFAALTTESVECHQTVNN